MNKRLHTNSASLLFGGLNEIERHRSVQSLLFVRVNGPKRKNATLCERKPFDLPCGSVVRVGMLLTISSKSKRIT